MQSNAIKRAALYEVVADVEGADAVLNELLQSKPQLNRYDIFRELAMRVDGVDAEYSAQSYSRICHDRILAADEVPGAFALLRALHAGGRVAVINSATPKRPLRELVQQLRFSHLITDTYGMPAGKLANLDKAMTRVDVRADATVVIGDGEADRQSAEQAGCRFIGVVSDNNDFECAPDIVVDRLDRLIPALTSP